MIFMMALPNIFGLYMLAPVVRAELDSYLDRLAKGEIVRLSQARETA